MPLFSLEKREKKRREIKNKTKGKKEKKS